MRTINVVVNGRPVSAQVEARTSLADFLREQLLLTGTHVGCEQGICGACTVEVNGEIARSCIAYAVQLDGAEVTTIEGFEDDPTMARLREGFGREHGLQCGYCTPGMLITARDLVQRRPDLDEAGIRAAMSGNLCRCTGYMGIIAAIRGVMAEASGEAPPATAPGGCVGPAPGPEVAATAQDGARPAAAAPPAAAAAPAAAEKTADLEIDESALTRLEQRFEVSHPPAEVWAFLADLEAVARCLPGASVTRVEGDRFEGEMRVKLGPVSTAFANAGRVSRDESEMSARVLTAGSDRRSASRVKGRVDYRVRPADGGGSLIEVEVGYALAGALAQFGRSGIVVNLADRLTAEFARNMEARLSGTADDAGGEAAGASLDAGGLFWSVLWSRLRGLFRRGG